MWHVTTEYDEGHNWERCWEYNEEFWFFARISEDHDDTVFPTIVWLLSDGISTANDRRDLWPQRLIDRGEWTYETEEDMQAAWQHIIEYPEVPVIKLSLRCG